MKIKGFMSEFEKNNIAMEEFNYKTDKAMILTAF